MVKPNDRPSLMNEYVLQGLNEYNRNHHLFLLEQVAEKLSFNSSIFLFDSLQDSE